MLMKEYLIQLWQYVAANQIQFGDDCDHPALDSLYWHYSGCHNMSNEKTKAASRDLHDYLGDLSSRENDNVFSLVGILCAEHERIAFLAGLQLGAQLMLELTEEYVCDA